MRSYDNTPVLWTHKRLYEKTKILWIGKNMNYKDVTDIVDFQNPDDELLPVTKCVCGFKFDSWEFTISIYKDDPYECPDCGAKLFFRNAVRVYQVIE